MEKANQCSRALSIVSLETAEHSLKCCKFDINFLRTSDNKVFCSSVKTGISLALTVKIYKSTGEDIVESICEQFKKMQG